MVSGFSVFFNSLAVKAVPNSYFFTSAKNIVVALLLGGFLIALRKKDELLKLKRIEWAKLAFVGVIGGSIPFLLFFKGMSLSSQAAVNGAFIQKTLFIWVTLLAFVFLKEKLSVLQYLAIGFLIIGVYIAGGPKNLNFGLPELLIFIATLMWAIEAVIVKKFLRDIDTQILAFGRMFFGSLVMIFYLIQTHNYTSVFKMTGNQFDWIILTSILLFIYVNFYYMALKKEKAGVVTSILAVAFPVTVIFYNFAQGADILKSFSLQLPLLAGALLILFAPSAGQIFRQKIKALK